jgi:hypothetical protein
MKRRLPYLHLCGSGRFGIATPSRPTAPYSIPEDNLETKRHYAGYHDVTRRHFPLQVKGCIDHPRLCERFLYSGKSRIG